MAKSDPIIEISNLHKTLADKEVLTGVDLRIERSETRVIIGQSGCGKSVLLKHIIGLMHPDQGEIRVEGRPIAHLSEMEMNEVRTNFGMLFQGAALFDSLTVGENIAFRHIQSRRYSAGEIRRIVDEKLAMVGLHGIAALKPAELSGGMQKRVGLARAISANPKIILYDEPTTGLDPIMADQINDLIIHLQEVLNVTSIAVTHDMVSAEKIGDNISMLYGGKVIETRSAETIFRSRNPYVKQFINGEAYGPITSVRPFETKKGKKKR